MHQTVLSLGSNLGNREENISRMQREVSGLLSGQVLVSPLMETEPVGTGTGQRWFLNRIISGNYHKSPLDLLDECLKIEKSMGRNNKGGMKPRTADIDILFFEDIVIESDRLTVPHPSLTKRRFCIEGVNSILPDLKHPVTGLTLRKYYVLMDENLKKQKISYL